MFTRTAVEWERLYNAALSTLPPELRPEAESGKTSNNARITWVQQFRRFMMQMKYSERRNEPLQTDTSPSEEMVL